jgi:hypothetical protein
MFFEGNDMQTAEALKILHALADGADPNTGEVFSPESPYQHPQTVRALMTAVQVMERQRERERRNRFLSGNAGKAWDKTEQEKLCRDFDAGTSIEDLASRLGRTHGAIQSRLMKLGRITLADL